MAVKVLSLPVDVFAITHYRLEQKPGSAFQIQTQSRMKSASRWLELVVILAAVIACPVTVVKNCGEDQTTLTTFTSHTGTLVPRRELCVYILVDVLSLLRAARRCQQRRHSPSVGAAPKSQVFRSTVEGDVYLPGQSL